MIHSIVYSHWDETDVKYKKKTNNSVLTHFASEQYLCIIGPSNGSASLTDSPSLDPMNEKTSGKQRNFTPDAAAS